MVRRIIDIRTEGRFPDEPEANSELAYSILFLVPWSNGNDSSLSKRRSGFDSPWDRHI